MNIETGLTEDVVVENESVEYLNFEIARLEKQVAELTSSLSEQVSENLLDPATTQDVGTKKRIKIRTTEETILVSLGLIACLLAKEKSIYMYGKIPSANRIMNSVKEAIGNLEFIDPDNDNHKILLSKLDRDISAGFKLLKDIFKID